MCLEQRTVGSRQKPDEMLMNTVGRRASMYASLPISRDYFKRERGIFPKALFWT